MAITRYPAFWLTLGLLLAAEVAVRLFFPHSVSGRFAYGYDPEAGVVEKDNGQVALIRAGGRRFYPQTFPARRPPGTLRFMVIGDSVPRGPNLAASYGKQLQAVLTARGLPVEVINMAVPGFGVRRCQLVVRLALRYQPSLILLHLNDSNEFEDEREYRRYQEFQGWHPRNLLMKSFIFARAYELKTERIFWRLLPEKIRLQAGVSDADAELAARQDQELQARWRQRVAAVTRETVAMITGQQVPVLLLAQATCQQGAAGYFLDDHGLDTLAQSLAGPLVWPFSLRAFFSAIPGFWHYFADGSHLTAAGHRLLAQGLADYLHSRWSGTLTTPASGAGTGVIPGERGDRRGEKLEALIGAQTRF